MRCIFCGIVSGTVPVEMVAETSQYIAFRDREPLAPTHILIVPKAHIDGVNAATRSDIELLGRLIFAAASVAPAAAAAGAAAPGFRAEAPAR